MVKCPCDLCEEQGHLDVRGEARKVDEADGKENCMLGLWVQFPELPEENADLGPRASKPQPTLDTAHVARGHKVPVESVPVFLRNRDPRYHCSPFKVLLY